MSDVLSELTSYVHSKSYKHTPYINLHKAVIYGYLDKLNKEEHSKRDTPRIACKLPLSEDDERVAIETVDRLVRYTCNSNRVNQDCIVTKDEAINLRNIIYSVCEDNNDRQ